MKRLSILISLFGILLFTGCSDLLETDSARQVFDPRLDQKTDSMFFALGILEAMQQVADQYVFQGELRGDLVTTTQHTDSMLTQLAVFSATTANRYDSAYAYYRVINNCNYYIAHRDTTLLTGATNVVIDEYAAVKAIRAWAYLQLVRSYGSVPFFTEPLTQITQIENSSFPELDLAGIVRELAPDLEQYTGFSAPTYANVVVPVGATNSGQAKTLYTGCLMIPVDVILGDLYLENNDYAAAARHYIVYLTQVAPTNSSAFFSFFSGRRGAQGMGYGQYADRPSDWDVQANGTLAGAGSWAQSIFITRNTTEDIITYIPMAVNRTLGPTTQVPAAFGYNYYATSTETQLSGGLYADEIQIEPSQALYDLSDSTDYYYYVAGNAIARSEIKFARLGDQRLAGVIRQGTGQDSAKVWVRKYENGNIVLYRTSTVLLHLAEAFNRLGMTDAAFAILKDGIGPHLLEPDAAYMTEATRQALQTTYPLLSAQNMSRFSLPRHRFGIHMHGAGQVRDFNGQDYVFSPYQPDTIVGNKMRQIARTFHVSVGTTKQDTINAMEDLLCDEYALELAFEGTRYFDLMRLARHKNEAGLYDPNFGSKWLAAKLAFKNPAVNLEDPRNWYLPFK